MGSAREATCRANRRENLACSGSAIAAKFKAHYADIYPIANRSTTYAFSCEQHYIIDPTGWSIQTDLDFQQGTYPGCDF